MAVFFIHFNVIVAVRGFFGPGLLFRHRIVLRIRRCRRSGRFRIILFYISAGYCRGQSCVPSRRDGGQRGSNQGFVMVRGQAGWRNQTAWCFCCGVLAGQDGRPRAAGFRCGQRPERHRKSAVPAAGSRGNVGRRHQLSIMENKRDIGTMPWGAAALNGEILIEEIAPHRAGFRRRRI